MAPFEVGTIALASTTPTTKELAFSAQTSRWFLKGPGSVVGHRGRTRRSADATFITTSERGCGKPAGRRAAPRRFARRRLLVANDYAIRHLENWYRPNLRVKNRDGGTVLGPWLVDAADIGSPPQLDLRTFVNGRLAQQGNTRDLIFDVPFLIEYLSAFMTLSPGDVILTGTPEGVSNVAVGDEVVCEIEGIGRLVNSIAGDAEFGR